MNSFDLPSEDSCPGSDFMCLLARLVQPRLIAPVDLCFGIGYDSGACLAGNNQIRLEGKGT
jgi:hypothetical protein